MTGREALEEQQKPCHYGCIHAINTQLDTLLPVARIPPELLFDIFLHTAGHRAHPKSRPPTVRSWICVTHVCRHWRETALQCTSLWSRIDVPSHPQRIAEFLVRSKDFPLSMTLSFRPLRQLGTQQLEASKAAVLLALSALHRVQTLTVDASEKPTDEVLEHLGGCAPLLKSLTITGASDSSRITKFSASISSMLSHPESRRLRTLETAFCCVPWTNISCGSLTHLVIHGDMQVDPGESSISSFFKALSRMSRLEELELTRVFFRRSMKKTWWDGSIEVIPTLPDPIALPYLRRLRTNGEPACSTTTLLNNLLTPSLSHLSVTVVQSMLEEERVLLFAAMAQKAATLGQPGTVSFSRESLCTSIRAYRDVFQRTTDPKEDSTTLWFWQHVPVLEYQAQDYGEGVPLARLCALLPLGDVQVLLLNRIIPNKDEWLGLTQCMEAVTELRLHSGANYLVSPGMLLSLKQAADGNGHAPFVLPNLRAFTIDEAVFSEDFPASRGPEPSKTGAIAELLACFAQRAQEGAEIRTLRILHAQKLWEEDLERLRAVVSCVESDGQLESASADGSLTRGERYH
ncbi:hypothetical protein C8Q72DRAFT_434197 [Fomitopsis betulina]|nr:hypothetical protein C8Q72DRAFT_434197 [Fomitopsis betulina]